MTESEEIRNYKVLYDSLVEIIKDRFGATTLGVVALSGGVDSALVAHAAHTALGERCVAVTVQSEFTTSRDFTRAVEVSERIGIEHHPLIMRMLADENVRQNNSERCFHCKRAIFRMMRFEYGDHCLFMDGTNADDDPDRPGRKALREFSVFSPLEKAGLTKKRCVNWLGLWDCPIGTLHQKAALLPGFLWALLLMQKDWSGFV